MNLKKEKLSSLFWLNEVGGVCYKKDFYFLLDNDTHESRTYKYLLDNEFIKEYEITSENRKKCVEDTATIVALTSVQSKRSQLATLFDCPSFLNKPKKIASSKLIHTRTIKTNLTSKKKKYNYLTEIMYPALNKASVKIMFHSAGVRTSPTEKPSLSFLRKFINYDDDHLLYGNKLTDFTTKEYLDQKIIDSCKTADGGRIDFIKVSKLCKQFVKDGLFYTKEEFKQYDEAQHNKSASDSYASAKFEGIYFNLGTCIVIYIHASSQKTRLKVYKSSINNLNEKLEELIISPFAKKCNRPVPGFDNVFSDNKTAFKHSINSLVISISNSLVPTMVLGAKKGVLGRSESNFIKNRAESENIRTDFLDSNTALYGLIFVVQKNEDGIRHIKYIVSHSIESWRTESSKVLEYSNKYSDDSSLEFGSIATPSEDKIVPFFPGVHKDTDSECLFLPVYEIKLLARIHDISVSAGKELMVLTDKKMCDFVSHSLRLGTVDNSLNNPRNIKTNIKFAEIELINKFAYFTGIKDKFPEVSDSYDENIYSLEQFKSIKLSDVAYKLNRIVVFDEFFIYNKYGKIDGKVKFDEYLYSEKDQIADYSTLPKSEQIKFFNSISRGSLSLQKAYNLAVKKGFILNDIEKSSDENMHILENHKHGIYISLEIADYERLVELAKKHKASSVSAYAKDLILKHTGKQN